MHGDYGRKLAFETLELHKILAVSRYLHTRRLPVLPFRHEVLQDIHLGLNCQHLLASVWFHQGRSLAIKLVFLGEALFQRSFSKSEVVLH